LITASTDAGDGKVDRDSLLRVSRTKRATQLPPRAFAQTRIGIGQESFKCFLDSFLAEVKSRLRVEQHLLADVFGRVGWKHGGSILSSGSSFQLWRVSGTQRRLWVMKRRN
jgi:hypothetical protein